MDAGAALGALGTVAEVGPKIAKAVVGPLAALDIHVRYRGRRVRLALKNGAVVEGILLGQGLARRAHTLRIQDDRGDEHAVLLDEVLDLIVVRDVRLAIANPGAGLAGFGLFVDAAREDLADLAEGVALARSRVRREDVLPGLVALALLDAPWDVVSVEVGEPTEMEEPVRLGPPPPQPSYDAVRGTLRLAAATEADVRMATERMRDFQGELAARIRSEGIRVHPLFFAQIGTAVGEGLADIAARMLGKVGSSLDAATLEAYVGGAGFLAVIESGRATFIERGTGEIVRSLVG